MIKVNGNIRSGAGNCSILLFLQPAIAKTNFKVGGKHSGFLVQCLLLMRDAGGVAMKLSEKIVGLRKMKGMTQEELASLCKVSRQSISKWEADISLPETEKLMILGEVFHVSMDVLLKEELTLSEVKEAHSCRDSAIQRRKQEVYEGVLIKESITDDTIIDLLNVHKIELWNTGGKPKYWTVLFFTSDKKNFPEQISKVMVSDPDNGGGWFADFKAGNVKFIVFKDKILKYQIGNQAEKDYVCNECRKMGISNGEMNWSE